MQVQSEISKSSPKQGVDLTTRDLSWFSERVERGRREPFSEIVTVTPDIARRILAMNEQNRTISNRLIEMIASDIRSGLWVLNGESIVISSDGYLNDGQHRLLAVVLADKPIQSVMMFGVSRASRMTVDMGRARKVSDFFTMQGVVHAHRIAALARLMLAYESGKAASIIGGGRNGTQITKQDILQQADDFGEVEAESMRRIGLSKFSRSVGGSAFLPAAYLIIKRFTPLDVEIFFDKLLSGADLSQDSAVLWLRQKLFEATKERGFVRSVYRLELVLRYWNAYIEDKTMTRHFTATGTFPKIKT